MPLGCPWIPPATLHQADHHRAEHEFLLELPAMTFERAEKKET